MNINFFILILIAIIGISVSILSLNNEFLALTFGLLSVIIYFVRLSTKKTLTSSEVDSIYYFGFLVTLVTLLVTAISIGMKQESLISLRQVLTQFGLGLSATGFALLFRIMLLSKSQLPTEQDISKAFERMYESINKTISKFDDSTFYIDAFTKKMAENLEKMQTEFNEKIGKTYDKFLDDMETVQKNTLKNLEKVQEKAFENINESMQKQNKIFENTTEDISKTVKKLEKDINDINFKHVSNKIEEFTGSVQKNISNISDSYNIFNENTKITLNELKEISKSISNFSGSITKKINKLEPLHEIVDSFNNFNKSWSVFLNNLQNTNSAIEEVKDTFNKFATLNEIRDNLEKEIINTTNNLKVISLSIPADNTTSLSEVLNRSAILIDETNNLLEKNLDKIKEASDDMLNLVVDVPKKTEKYFNELQSNVAQIDSLNISIKNFTNMILKNRNDLEIALLSLIDTLNNLNKIANDISYLKNRYRRSSLIAKRSNLKFL